MERSRTTLIPLVEPSFGGNEARYLADCIASGWVSSAGPFVDRFENQAAAVVRADHAVATSSGTAALHVALIVAGVRPDDEVLVPAMTFIAPANAVRYVSAWPVFFDAEPRHWQLDVRAVEAFLGESCERRDGNSYNKQNGRRVSAVLAVDILGHPCEMTSLRSLAEQYGLVVVEDATESLGATLDGRPVGSLGDIGCLSFNGNKVVTAGGGGMILTDDPAWAAYAKHLTTQARVDPAEYIHDEIGFNYRLTNLQAALGCAQLEQLGAFISRKRQISAAYLEAFEEVPGIGIMEVAPGVDCSWWMFTITVDAEVCAVDSRGLIRVLQEQSIMSRPLWQPMNLSPAHAASPAAACPVAERLFKQAVSLPSSVGLTAEDQAQVIDAVLTTLRG